MKSGGEEILTFTYLFIIYVKRCMWLPFDFSTSLLKHINEYINDINKH